jgi:hypothetical protein
MAGDQCGERRLVATGGEPFQEPGVREPREGPFLEELLDQPRRTRPECRRHRADSSVPVDVPL